MNPNNTIKFVESDLSYRIMGLLFDVHNRLGGSFDEKYYQRAVETLLNKQGFKFRRELKANIDFDGERIGRYFLDFLIEEKVVLELKAVPQLLPIHYRQIKSYLKVKNLELGILANFRGNKLTYKRILNKIHSD